jgi:hypothetical protein
MKPQMYETCKNECKQDHCCGGDCISSALGFVKNKKFDKDSAIKAISAAFPGDAAWAAVKFKTVLAILD